MSASAGQIKGSRVHAGMNGFELPCLCSDTCIVSDKGQSSGFDCPMLAVLGSTSAERNGGGKPTNEESQNKQLQR